MAFSRAALLPVACIPACILLLNPGCGGRLSRGAEQGDAAADDGNASSADAPSSPSNDGSCRQDCLGGGCQAGLCQPVTLASDVGVPGGLAVDGTYVYWTDLSNKSVEACAKTACNEMPITLTPSLDNVADIAVDATNIYWTAFGDVEKCPKAACQGNVVELAKYPALVVPSGYGAIAVDAANVYWTTQKFTDQWPSPWQVMRCAIGGCNGNPTLVADVNGSAGGLASDGSYVYWTNGTPNGIQVMKCAVAGCNNTPVILATDDVTPDVGPGHIAVDANSIYWSEPNDISTSGARLMKCGLDGANPTTLATGLVGPDWIATDGVTVYWTDGGVYSYAVSGCGGGPKTLFEPTDSTTQYAEWLAIDPTSIYFFVTVQSETYSIVRLAR